MPPPTVDSSVIRLDIRAVPAVDCDRKSFFRVVRASFAQRRKTLLNALSSGFSELSKAELAEIIEACGLAPTVRGETLDIPAFAAIANALAARLS